MNRIEVEVIQAYIGVEGHVQPRTRLNVDEKRARYLIEKGLARVYKRPEPTETKPAGPAEVKAEAISAKKSSDTATTGLSTGSPSSNRRGRGKRSWFSAAAPASPESNATGAGTTSASTDDASGG